MINNIQFKIIAGKKLTKFPNFTQFLTEKMPDYIIRQRNQGQVDAKSLRLRPKFWPRGHFALEDLTSLHLTTTILRNSMDRKKLYIISSRLYL